MTRQRLIGAVLLLVTALGLFNLLYGARVLYDADAYYHLAIAKKIADGGFPSIAGCGVFSSAIRMVDGLSGNFFASFR